MDTQTQKIRDWLARGRSLTALDALREFGCLRLAARINDLRREGLEIVTDMVEVDGKKFARYTMRNRYQDAITGVNQRDTEKLNRALRWSMREWL